MEIIKKTDFSHGVVCWPLEPPRVSMLVVIKATFALPASGVATLAEVQDPATGPLHHEGDPELSLRYPNDFALIKPRAECFVTGACRPLTAKPVQRTNAAFQVGSIRKSFVVIGDRVWKRTAAGVVMSEPEPFSHMPLRWERCFGGAGFEENPHGRGIAAEPDGSHRLPNIEHPESLIAASDERPRRVGAFPIGMNWKARQKLAGTYDARWKESRAPWLAKDFRVAFFNEAPEEQQHDDYFRGDEEIALRNLHPEHSSINTRLPGIHPRALVERSDGRFEEIHLVLDTITLDADRGVALALWRGRVELEHERLRPDGIARLFVTDEPANKKSSLEALKQQMAKQIEQSAAEIAAMSGQAPPKPEERDATTFFIPTAEAQNQKTKPFARASKKSQDVHATQLLTPIQALDDQDQKPTKTFLPAIKAEDQKTAELPVLDKKDEEVIPTQPLAQSKQQQTTQVFVSAAKAAEQQSTHVFLPAADAADPQQSTRVFLPAGKLAEAARVVLAEAESAGETAEGDAKLEELKRALQSMGISTDPKTMPSDSAFDPTVPPDPAAVKDAFEKSGLPMPDEVFAMLEAAALGSPSSPEIPSPPSTSEVDLRKVVEDTHRLGEPLMGDFTGVNLSELDLRGLQARDAIFTRANFRGANLERAILDGANLVEADLHSADLGNASLQAADLTEAILEGANLSHARCDGAIFDKAQMSGANFDKASLRNAELNEANLSLANLTNAICDEAIFNGSSLQGARAERASFVDARMQGVDAAEMNWDHAQLKGVRVGRGANFRLATIRHCEAEGAHFRDSDFEGVVFSGSRLDDADFSRTSMLLAKLSECSGKRARFQESLLTGAVLTGSNLFEGIFRDATLDGADFSNTNLYCADFFGASGQEVQLTGADLNGTAWANR